MEQSRLDYPSFVFGLYNPLIKNSKHTVLISYINVPDSAGF